MRHRPQGEYPACWPVIAEGIKAKHGRACERCKSPSVPGKILTVHHLDGDKANVEDWNLAALCQVCHLHIQGRVFLPQAFMFEHSEWFRPHWEGYMARRVA